ncbi:MAG: tetratricopeptide repeat protein [Planctomyces sp.]|nr:tetratricopeptide repeat protein [Planctomyces sp.]
MASPAISEVDALCDQARALMRDKQFSQARDLYEQALAKDARSIPACSGAAASSFALKDYEKAAAHYKKLSMLDVRRADPLINLGAVYNRMGDYGNAARTLRQALSKDRKSASGYYNLGIAYKGQNQLTMAISAYKEAIRADPRMPEAYHNLANLHFEMGNFQQAIVHFEKALEIEPKFEKARTGLEKARNAQEEARLHQNPFGRLVNENEVAARQTEVRIRQLTAQERFEDRQALHQFAKETEQLAVSLLALLRDELSPAILKLQHTCAQPEDARSLYREGQQLSSKTARFQALAEALRERTNSIREHERVVRG